MTPDLDKPIELWYPSRRLVGLEVELDADNAQFHDPGPIEGWQSKSDVSLRNGREYILQPALPAVEAVESIRIFSEATLKAKMHVGIRGGYHIHVQVDDYTHRHAAILALLYQKYIEQISLLVSPSRRHGTYSQCSGFHNEIQATWNKKLEQDGADIQRYRQNPLEAAPEELEDDVPAQPIRDLTMQEALKEADYADEKFQQLFEAKIVELFKLSESAPNREIAKAARQKMVTNFAMLRCRDPLERTVEFRQPSPSKKFQNIYGWLCLSLALVELAKLDSVQIFLRCKPTWRNFIRLLRHAEAELGAKNLAAWANWRDEYLNSEPSEENMHKIFAAIIDTPRGIFSIAQKSGLNLAVIKKALAKAVTDGKVNQDGKKYRAAISVVALGTVKKIAASWKVSETPAPAIEETVAA